MISVGRPAAVQGARHAEAMSWSLVVSLLLHVAFAVVLSAQMAARSVEPGDPAIVVELVSPEQFEAAADPHSAEPEDETPRRFSPTNTPDALPVPNTRRPVSPGVMIQAKHLLSARALADPRSRQARERLPLLHDTERMVQLCDLEAMEQIHEWRQNLRPETVVAYAMSELVIRGDTIAAGGAALRSEDAWYGLKFKCALAPTHDSVVSFEFLLGDPIPEEQWEARNLPGGTADR
jgi:hypothetical protein